MWTDPATPPTENLVVELQHADGVCLGYWQAGDYWFATDGADVKATTLVTGWRLTGT